MVFAARSLPYQIPNLPTGLRSRLGRGLIARIRQPDTKSCRKIVVALLGQADMVVSPDVYQYLLQDSPVNFYQIREYVERLKEFVENDDHPSDSEEKAPTTNGNDTPEQEEIAIEVVQKEVCDAYSVSMEALQGKTKSRPLVIARHVGMYLSRRLTASTYATIGEAFGGRNHSTVIYACRKMRAEMKRNPRLAECIVEIEKKLSRFHKIEYLLKPES
jgi:chromosomal replication initiator protein